MKAELKRRIQAKLDDLTRQKVSSGVQLALGWKDQTLGIFSSGTTSPEEKSKVSSKTRFDLASLTKILSTTYLMMQSVQSNKLSLDQPLKNFFPFLQSDLKNRTLEELLNHRAHLPAIIEIKDDALARKEREHYLIRELDENYDVLKKEVPDVLYSDVGFLILGFTLEQIYSTRLREIFGEKNTLTYGPMSASSWFNKICSRHFGLKNIARSLDLKGEMYLEGEVQDSRAAYLEGDAGHSGLFGAAAGIESWGLELYKAYHGKSAAMSDRVVRQFIDFETAEKRQTPSSFINGFDRPSKINSQAGKYFSPTSTIGHLGYTGTSFWMDIERGFRVTLLCHRFQKGISPDQLKSLRPGFHDWLWTEVFSKLG